MDSAPVSPVVLEWEPEVEDWYDVAGARGLLGGMRRAAVRSFWKRATTLHRKTLAVVGDDGVSVETAFDTKRYAWTEIARVDETERVWVLRTGERGQGVPLAKRGAKSPADVERLSALFRERPARR